MRIFVAGATGALGRRLVPLLVAEGHEVAAGARRFVAQCFAGWTYAREGGPVKSEEDPLDPNPPEVIAPPLKPSDTSRQGDGGRPTRRSRAAIRLLLRPATSIGEGGPHWELVRRRRFPIVGKGTGVWSFIHVDDAASATLAAMTRGSGGVYNIVDDEPAAVAAWLPALAAAVGAPPPLRVPTWLARLAVGEAGVSLMTQVRCASNAKAKHALDWEPAYPSWREGFRRRLA
ncbi:MAG: NAD-dependent epimerase/dehydratase family protein [Nitriliruptorales bacterium]